MYKAFFLMSLVFLVSCGSDPLAPKDRIQVVRPYVVQTPPWLRPRPFPGVTRAQDRANLSFRVNGPLIEFPVRVGDIVQKGDLMARIDPRDYEVALEVSQAQLDKSKAERSFAQSDYARAKKIQQSDPGAISATLVDRKREELHRLEALVKQREAEVQASQDRLFYTYLQAPYAGQVTARFVENFEMVREKQEIVRLLNLEQIEMVVDIPERLIHLIPHVEAVSVVIDSIPGHTFTATIREIGKESAKISRTYPVTLWIQPQDPHVRILAGMSGEAQFSISLTQDRVQAYPTIPPSAVITDEETQKSYVFVVLEDRLAKREVQLGSLNNEGIEVVEGVSPGDVVVFTGMSSLSDGEQVRVIQ